MGAASFMPGCFYWAKSSRFFDGKITVVQVSTIFGAEPDYWTLALLGTDQHAMPSDFEIIAPAEMPEDQAHQDAAEERPLLCRSR
ncbi:hypothetical protein [Rhizobium hidalgonense]|uniref:Uncharacterized protein n=1 Tax=Rhizobium hidalgonense TaxID=1538159 RepID=A0ABX4JLT1_9HYPH|nr:hypothetical protein [Rhizobium hidalgonense]MDR9815097.1 hypothetical protein [Rhizobium hidalgonense]MDR9820775.1 hypothetical protein [Rhizobium hidalgonense]PDT20998.1 hypothetical protein CO674_25275 [Rhizobium hidalgonense]PON07230.1 hypothetical protein ATY29_12950 [Rhizobium hidalgonense]